MSKLCSCGSGLERDELVDAAGIFCAYVCDKCEASVRAKYNPAIFDNHSHYAMSGEEEDIGCGGHSWVEETRDDGKEGRIYCENCGADGDG